MTVKITARPNGPYLVEGDVEIYDPTGAKVDTSARPRIALCRCGASVTKPFCDGTHSKQGFQAAAQAALLGGLRSGHAAFSDVLLGWSRSRWRRSTSPARPR
jgi:CDGSH-type Zn-finger protein